MRILETLGLRRARASTPTSPSSGSTSTSARSRSGPPAGSGPAFIDALLAALPGLQEHGCSYGEPGGFIRRLPRTRAPGWATSWSTSPSSCRTWPARQVTFGKTRSAGAPGQLPRGLSSTSRRTSGSRRAGWRSPCSTRCCPPELRPGTERCPPDFDFARGAGRLHPLRPAPRARARAPCRWCAPPRSGGIPWIRLNEQSLIQFGHGRYQQRIQATVTSRTPHIAVELASDKEETNRILAQPRPAGAAAAAGAARGRRGRARPSGSATRWWSSRSTPTTAAASRSTCTTDEQVRDGVRRWRRSISRSVIVESFIDGRRPPDAGGQRRAGGGGEAGARATWWATATHTIERAGGRGEPRPAARHRPREGAHPARVRPPGRAAAGREGLHPADGARGGRAWSTSAPPATSPPAAPRPT